MALRQRFDFACGYCGTTETSVGAPLTVDHFHPTSRGGSDDESNWVYCCPACNSFKGAAWGEEEGRLLHPLRDDLALQVEERNGQLFGLTPRGELHIEQLHLNREQLVAQRRELLATAELQHRSRRAEERLERALERIEEASRS